MIRVQCFALYGPLAASTRYRLEQYAPGLRSFGIELQVAYLLGNDYLSRRFSEKKTPALGLLRSGIARLAELAVLHKCDAAIVHCELLPLVPGWLERTLLQKPYLYDFDDAFYLRYQRGKLAALKPLLGNKFAQFIKGASAVTAGNGELARYAGQFNRRTKILPTVVDITHHVPNRKHKSNIFTVGWIGSPSTAPFLEQIVGSLVRLANEGPVRLVVVGGRPPVVSGAEVISLPWSEKTEIELINSFDVGVMPLPDNEWSRGKCAFKLIQYMACGVPVIGSAVGANNEVVTPDCGYLASNDDDWLHALRAFRDNPSERTHAGEAGRQRVAENYSLQIALPQMATAILGITGR